MFASAQAGRDCCVKCRGAVTAVDHFPAAQTRSHHFQSSVPYVHPQIAALKAAWALHTLKNTSMCVEIGAMKPVRSARNPTW